MVCVCVLGSFCSSRAHNSLNYDQKPVSCEVAVSIGGPWVAWLSDADLLSHSLTFFFSSAPSSLAMHAYAHMVS